MAGYQSIYKTTKSDQGIVAKIVASNISSAHVFLEDRLESFAAQKGWRLTATDDVSCVVNPNKSYEIKDSGTHKVGYVNTRRLNAEDQRTYDKRSGDETIDYAITPQQSQLSTYTIYFNILNNRQRTDPCESSKIRDGFYQNELTRLHEQKGRYHGKR